MATRFSWTLKSRWKSKPFVYNIPLFSACRKCFAEGVFFHAEIFKREVLRRSVTWDLLGKHCHLFLLISLDTHKNIFLRIHHLSGMTRSLYESTFPLYAKLLQETIKIFCNDPYLQRICGSLLSSEFHAKVPRKSGELFQPCSYALLCCFSSFEESLVLRT